MHLVFYCEPVFYFCSIQLSGAVAKFQGKHRSSYRSGEDILSRMWACVRANNGIQVLISLLLVKTPLVDADHIRAMACKALCGLARSDKIRQVIGKLQLFNSGQLQSKFIGNKCLLVCVIVFLNYFL